MTNINLLLTESLKTGFIDKEVLSEVDLQPELLVNQKIPPKKILTTILREFDYCSEFYISVAFVTTSGIATIINKLKELEEKGVQGQILVSQYLNFTQPEALKRLLQFRNIEVRILTTGNAHAKGYIFKGKAHYNLIVGSSNLTASALCTNKEWNIKVSALGESGIIEDVLNEFQKDFKAATIVTLEYIEKYTKIYEEQFVLNQKISSDIQINEPIKVHPNLMQEEALKNLSDLRTNGKNKALIISATGTGKTYLSAFDAKNFNPKKLLFVVHRLTIAKDAMNTFKKVFGNSFSMGLYSGGQRTLDSDFIFSTVQTLSKTNHLEQFNKDYFDYIIIDETHRSAANSYKSILNYFEPKFLLGMTATPERTDGDDIFELFNHNIAYEIRLNRAMDEDMLSSFHYYGVTDLIVDDVTIEKKSDFNLLVSDERIERIVEQANFYGCDTGIIRGLIFCSRKEEAKELSIRLNQKGLKTIALTGDNSEEERGKAIELLESDNLSKKLDYIITVDIFNEGIDIPKINQIIMLRPTESAIIFIQQLGRGLRKADGKGYLTVIDFIGNYENNYMIPIALFGDTSYNKDTLRKLVNGGSLMIPGSSTVNFDEITKERIFKSIDSANLQLLSDLKKDYNLLKFRLGRQPMMMDFILNSGRDPFSYVNYSNSYYNFVQKAEKQIETYLNSVEVKLLELFSKEINNSKRVVETIILNELLSGRTVNIQNLNTILLTNYGFSITNDTYNSSINNLNFKFVRKENDVVQLENGELTFSDSFKILLQNSYFFKYLKDNVDYGLHSYKINFSKDRYVDGFVLYQKYSRKDVCRILNWDFNEEATVYGYKLSKNSCPIFVNYHKEENITSSTNFPEEFLNPSQFLWYSKPQRKLSNSTLLAMRNHDNKLRMPLFMKKHNGEGTDFYYMGDVKPIDNTFKETTIKNDKGIDLPVVKVVLELNQSVENSIYSYITSNEVKLQKEIQKIQEEIKEDSQLISTSTEIFTRKIPLYNFTAAAGSFSEMQADNDYTLIDAPASISNVENYFACKIIGESMNRRIPSESICLFKLNPVGSRNGKIVLVENIDIQDPDFNSSFTIKTYTSEKLINEDGQSVNSVITLLPNSTDSKYLPIVLDEDSAQNMRVIGEFIQILP